jgi:RND family efflux transporter MFP subunit
MKRTLPWIVPLLVIAAVGLLVARAQQSRGAAPPGALPAAVLELSDADLVTVQYTELTRSLEVSGSLKAVTSAAVKARVAGEVRSVAVREGETVRRGQLLVEMETTELDWRLRQAEQTASAARAQLDISRRTLQNNRALVAQGFISATALDNSAANEAAAQANLQAALAAVEIARKARADAVLTAPISGIVSQRLVEPGERAGVDARLLEIVDLSRIELEAAVPAEDVGALRIGASAVLRVDGIGEAIAARVARINPSAQPGSRAVMVYVAVDPHPALRQGLFARGRVELERRSVLAVPTSAIRTDQARPYVLVVEGERIVRRFVDPGPIGEAAGRTLREVGATLPEGTRLLAGEVGAVSDGTPVRLTRLAASAGDRAAATARASASSAR